MGINEDSGAKSNKFRVASKSCKMKFSRIDEKKFELRVKKVCCFAMK